MEEAIFIIAQLVSEGKEDQARGVLEEYVNGYERRGGREQLRWVLNLIKEKDHELACG